jgi:hypothetical protein
MAPKNLEEDGQGHDERHLLQVNDLIQRAGEMKPSDDFADNQDGGNGDKKPLKAQEPIFPIGKFIVKAIFKLHEPSFLGKMIFEYPNKD